MAEVTKAHLGSIVEKALNADKLQGKVPSDFLAVGGKAVDSDKLDGLDSSQFLRSDIPQTISGQFTIISNEDGILNLRQSGNTGTAGVKNGHWNYIQFQDSEGDRQGYFGIDSVGNFAFASEITGRVLIGGQEVFHNGNKSGFLVNSSRDGFMSIAEHTKLAGIQSNAINQSTADGRYVQLAGSSLTGSLVWDGNQQYKGLYWGAKQESATAGYTQLAFIRQATPEGQLEIGSDDQIHFMETDSMISKVRISTNAGNLEVDGTIKEGGILLSSKYAPLSHVGSGGTAHALVTTTAHGFMDFSDKVKLDGIQSGAINQTTADSRYLKLTGGTVDGYLRVGTTREVASLDGDPEVKRFSITPPYHSGVWDFWTKDIGGTAELQIRYGVTNTLRLNHFGDLLINRDIFVNSNRVIHNGNKADYLASSTSHGFMSKEDKARFDTMETGGEVNQNAFSHIAVGGQATVSAGSKTDTLTFIAGTGMAITTDASGVSLSFTSTLNSDYLALDGSNSMRGDLLFDSGTKSINFATAKLRDNGNGSLIISSTGVDKAIYLRANGDTDTTNQVVLSLSSFTYAGKTIWHGGNFDPSTKLNLSGGTMTGSINMGGEGKEIRGIGSLQFANVEPDRVGTVESGRLFFDENFGTSTGSTSTTTPNLGDRFTDGGGLAIYTEDGWGGLISTSNMKWLKAEFETLTAGTTTLNGYLTVNNLMKVQSAYGNVEIGAKNSDWMHFYTDRSRYYFDTNVTIDGAISSFSTDDLILQTGDSNSGGTTRITVKNSTGNVGIGTTAPLHKLDVFGNVRADKFYIGTDAEINETGDNLNISDRSNVNIIVDSNGGETERYFSVRTAGLDEATSTELFRVNQQGDAIAQGGLQTGDFRIEFNSTEGSLDFIFVG